MRLSDGWTLALCDPGAAATPDEARGLDKIPAQVPGTAAGALAAAGRWSWDDPAPLDALDAWYATEISGHGPHLMIFEGLATIADVWLDDALILRSETMFGEAQARVELGGVHRLAIRFHALATNIVPRKGRARWRPRMIQPSDLRFSRTSALGHMPGFAPPAPVVGPWRPVRLVSLQAPALVSSRVSARLDGDDGIVDIELAFDRALSRAPQIECEGVAVALSETAPGTYAGALRLPAVERWRPHTHGAPRLYAIHATIDGPRSEVARIGFRTIEAAHGQDGVGFGLRVNGEDVFCRGAVWTPLDAITLQNDPEALSRTIALAKDAGVNMLRVTGIAVYEDAAFYRACDEAGILVWQDFMFSNFDYPAGDPDFVGVVEREAREFLQRTSASPCIAALCGGNEVYQQGAMMGVGETSWRSPLFEDVLAAASAASRPDCVYVANSPCGGALPFHADCGVTHYYGVGAYRRPLEDARRAHVHFASECLGFANVPEARTLAEDFGATPLASPLWEPRIPRDQGALQDFEQVRDHYIALLYSVDVDALKRDDAERYFALSRAAVAETIESTIGEWRRPGSSCAGALVWFWKDFWPSSGFGVVDWRGRPKSPYWAMRRAFRPVQVVVTDEGVNGLDVHCINESSAPFAGELTLRCFKDGETVVMRASRAIELAPRSSMTIRDCDLWGAFFDTGYAYRFGPPSHEATVATLDDAEGARIAESWHFPVGRSAALHSPSLTVAPFRDVGGAGLRLLSDKVAQSVSIEDSEGVPCDNWFHLAPGEEKLVRFRDGGAPTQGRVAALGCKALSYRAE